MKFIKVLFVKNYNKKRKNLHSRMKMRYHINRKEEMNRATYQSEIQK